MPCPFGYTSADGEGHGPVHDVDEEDEEGLPGGDPNSDQKPEKETMEWIFRNQIKSENDFKEKKMKVLEASKARLAQILQDKQQQVEFDPDFGNGSIACSELSELDSDVHSLSSLRSCADSWIEDKRYKKPAEGWVKLGAAMATALSGYCAFQSYAVMTTASSIPPGAVLNKDWTMACMAVAAFMVVCTGLLYFSTSRRSKRMLLASEAGLLITYALSTWLLAGMWVSPIALTPEAAACRNSGPSTCSALSKAKQEVSETVPLLMWSCLAVGCWAVVLASLGLWYVFELAYIEKKAAKYVRRHRRHKLAIPWHKIKVIGPVTNCGKTATGVMGMGHGPKPGGGSCPMGYT